MGTLVHTREGLKAIEKVCEGDWVLSCSQDGAAANFKQVTRTLGAQDQVVLLIRQAVRRGDDWINGDWLLVTPDQRFLVTGNETSWFPEDHPWHDIEVNLGWTTADRLCYGDLIQVSSGEHAVTTSSSSIEKLWQTTKPDIAWEAKAGDESGNLVTIRNGADITFDTDLADNELRSRDDSFRYRDEKPEWEQRWYFRYPVHDLEVEDFNTYCVGTFGAWVSGANNTV